MFSKQHSASLGAAGIDHEKGAKVFIQPFVSSSSLPVSAAAAPQLIKNRNGRRAHSTLALALTLLALVAVAVAAWGSSRGPQPPPSYAEAAGELPPRLSSLPSSSVCSRLPPRRRRRLPSAEAAVVAAALASAHDTEETKSDAAFPLAVVRAPLLTPAELFTLQHYARGSVYAEWGSGASTVLAAPMARRAVSIENQKSWCDEMVASADVDFWIKNNVLTYLCVDTGATGRFGTPTGESDPNLFVKYLDALDEAAAAVTLTATTTATTKKAAKKKGSSSSTRLSLSGGFSEGEGTGKEEQRNTIEANKLPPASYSPSSTGAFTVVLVDGRFRVACALKALWHLDHARGVLLVHDWVARGPQYHAPILKRYSLLAVVDRLAVLAPSSPPAASETSSGDEEEASRVRWWTEAAEEIGKYSRDAA
jgi:hypothetical protein